MWKGWRLFCSLVLGMSALTAVICWLTIPDFSHLAPYRIVNDSGPVVETRLPDALGQDLMLYLPSHGGHVDAALGRDRVLGSVSDIADSPLTRDRFFGLMTIPADLTRVDRALLRLTQRGNFQDVAMSPAFVGPVRVIAPVAEQHRRIGRAMQLLLPAALAISISISFLLIFFSRQPAKYMFLIAAFAIQFVLEIGDEPVLSSFDIAAQVPFLSTLVNGLIGMAIATWTSARRWQWQLLSGSMIAVLAMFTAMRITDLEFVPTFHAMGAIVFALWIVGVQVLDWAMLYSTRIMGRFVRTAGMATLFLGHSGLLAYHLLSTTRPGIELAFFLSNWTNVASSGAVILFAGGALLNETLAYRAQRRRMASMEHIVSGHHAELDVQSIALKAEIERAAVLEERQRFLRDMHDGLGGQLLTLLLRLRRAEGGAAVLAADVQTIIGDLRLMTSALDDDGVSLVSALERLRERVVAQCSLAAIALDWKMDIPPLIDVQFGALVSSLRMVEEAATNAVRHSGCRSLSISLTCASALTITVRDDGSGFVRTREISGTGLRSMEHRISKLGGTLTVDSAPGAGCIIVAAIPVGTVSQSDPTSQAGGLREQPRFSI